MSVPIAKILDRKGREVATTSAATSLADAVEALAEHDVGALVVVEGDRVTGVVSERDVVRRLTQGGSIDGLSVGDVMTSPAFTCEPSATVDDLMAAMTERRIRHLPVVGDDGGLAGIISIGDVVKARVGQLESENHQLHDYIQAR
jgi:CBS domain-containing protein